MDVGLQGNGNSKGESENWAGLDPSIGSTGSFFSSGGCLSPTSINVLNSTYNETVSCVGCVYVRPALWEETTLVLLNQDQDV